MKIIANDVKQERLIVEISNGELANLMGFYSRHSDGFPREIGAEVDVSALYQDAQSLERLCAKKDELMKFVADAADLVRKLMVNTK